MGDPLETRLFHKIHCCSNLLKRSYKGGGNENEQMQRRGQGRLLSILLYRDGLSMKEIVQKLDIRPSSAGELVDKLAQQGYVYRRNDGRDKRVCNVYLTESGRAAAAEFEQGMLLFYKDVFSGMEEDEIQQLDCLLAKLKNILLDKYGYNEYEDKGGNTGVATGR